MKPEKCGTILLVMIFAVLIPLDSMGAENSLKNKLRVDLGVLVQDYKWAEYTDTGNKVLEETGNFYGLTCAIESTKNMIGWRTGMDFFIGQVDYDGRTWSDIPVRTDVLYVGSTFYVDVIPGYRLDSGLWLKPFAGLGGKLWLRDLDDTKTSDGDPVKGAREWWGCVYGRAGLGAEYPLSEEMAVFAEAGLKLPIYARNEANFFMSDSLRAGLEPKQDFSGFGNVGIRWKQWGIRASYDALRFDRSDAVSSGMFDLYQPKSKSDIYSVDIFWSSGF